MQRRPRRTALAATAMLGVLLAACGGGPDEPTEDAGAGVEAPQDDGVEPDEPDPTDGDEQPGDEQAEEELSAAPPQEPARVTYQTSGADFAGGEGLVIAWDTPRWAMIFDDGKLVNDGERVLFCDAAGEGCFSMPTGGAGGQMAAGLGPFFGFTDALASGEDVPGVTAAGDAEIAGRSATCLAYDAAAYDPAAEGEGEYCFDTETRVLLRWSGPDGSGGTQTMEATEVTEPSPEDFEPTGPVQEMPQGGSGG